MVVEIVNVQRIMVNKTEDHPPIGPHRHCPKAFQLALERMQPETGQVHVRHRRGSFKTRQDVAQLICVVRNYSARVVVLVKRFSPLWRTDRIILVL